MEFKLETLSSGVFIVVLETCAIIESVDSICRDSSDMHRMYDNTKKNLSKFQNQ